mmetsp:Transcript_6330/g.18709  ORF Transcript_6330/g.18709 Transcript_6330/m.18709 type:complete len:200 (-) Transcript_6330:246-845(-)
MMPRAWMALTKGPTSWLPKKGSSPDMVSKQRPVSVARVTSTSGPKRTFAPFVTNSSATACAYSSATCGSNEAATDSNEGNCVAVPASFTWYGLKPWGPSCIFKGITEGGRPAGFRKPAYPRPPGAPRTNVSLASWVIVAISAEAFCSASRQRRCTSARSWRAVDWPSCARKPSNLKLLLPPSVQKADVICARSEPSSFA